MGLEERVGEHVELDGVAYDSHAGATIEVDGVPIYLDGCGNGRLVSTARRPPCAARCAVAR